MTNLIWDLVLASQVQVITSVGVVGQVGHLYQSQAEAQWRTILLMVVSSQSQLPQIYSIFHQILFANFLGMVPYSSTATVEQVISFWQAVTFLLGVLIMGSQSHRSVLQAAASWITDLAGTPLVLVPLMVILEIVAQTQRILSLGMRLSVNMITGHTLVKVCSGFINGNGIWIMGVGQLLLTLFLSQEILIAYLQAYIFTFMTCLTIKEMAQPQQIAP